ncbi:MAG: SUMF1/EgtB/PvdO family nonheme iron enzyme, partial [Pseudomonadota bacterium]
MIRAADLLALLAFGAALAVAVPATAQTPASATAWPEADYNPQPREGDVVLPMPCQGAMVFRSVRTGARGDGPLDDRLVRLGDGDPGAGEAYRQYVRTAHIAGAFEGPEGRFYLLAKYELSRGQAAALHADALGAKGCPDPEDPDNALAASDLSWFDAIDLSRRYTEWLLREAPAALSQAADPTAFIRLPTEAEWEFALRGGLAVSEAERRARLPLSAGQDISSIAWRQGPDSADNQIQVIGDKAPNALGFHDMLGNAEEIVLEPFTLNRVGRAFGQPGGFIARGGSIATPASRLSSALRTEYHLFSPALGGAVRTATMGTRFAVGAPALGDLDEATALSQAWEDARALKDVPTEPAVVESGGALADLEGLAETLTDQDLRRRITDASAALSREIAARNEAESRALGNLILSGGLMISRMESLDFRLGRFQVALEEVLVEGHPDRPKIARHF